MKSIDLMNEIISVMETGDYESASVLCEDLKNLMLTERVERRQLEPKIGIIQSALLLDQGRVDESMDVIHKSLMVDPNNYELYYTLALCKENTGDYEGAYFDYRMAIFLGKDSKDLPCLKKGFNYLCSYANANEYLLGKCCQKLIENRMSVHEYEQTSQFLSELLYDTNEVTAKTVLSEENMLLFIMLEITLCERNYMDRKAFEMDNTSQRYKNNVYEFKNVYSQIKFMCRRIWYGCALEDQKEICDVLSKYPVSGDMLAVILKYSVVQDVWLDTFQRVYALIQEEYPVIAQRIEEYYNWLNSFNLGGKLKCMDVNPSYNNAEIFCLNCQDMNAQKADDKVDENKVSIIFCTNDELYCKECNIYLKQLVIPEGMHLEILELRNATGMAAGYNYAMAHTNSKYKIYIHQDTFIIDRLALVKMIHIFQKYEDVGMIGIAGTTKLSNNGFWWSSPASDIRMNLYQDAILNILKSVSVIKSADAEDGDAMDGILLATSADIRWRDDVFDGWHFYDISQCYEFHKHGYRTVLANDENLWVMHETTLRKDEKNLYERYRTIFINEYFNYDFGE